LARTHRPRPAAQRLPHHQYVRLGYGSGLRSGHYRGPMCPMPQPGDVIPYSFTAEPGQCCRMVYDHKLQATHCRQPPCMERAVEGTPLAGTGTSTRAGSTRRSGWAESHNLTSKGPSALSGTTTDWAPLQWVAGTPPGTTPCLSTGGRLAFAIHSRSWRPTPCPGSAAGLGTSCACRPIYKRCGRVCYKEFWRRNGRVHRAPPGPLVRSRGRLAKRSDYPSKRRRKPPVTPFVLR
jgi:hypothetical protein